jgi:hypothetical protein
MTAEPTPKTKKGILGIVGDYARGWLLWAVIAAAVTLLVVRVGYDDLGAKKESRARCFAPIEELDSQGWAFYSSPNATDPARPDSPLQLSLVPDQTTTLDFGRSESVRVLDVDYRPAIAATSSGSGSQTVDSTKSLHKLLSAPPLQVDVSQFRRDDGAVLMPKMVKARARVIGDDRVRVSLCVDRRKARTLADPGTYRGTVSIIDPRVTRTDIPLVVDEADPRWTFPLFLVLVSIVAGSWVTWMVKEKKADGDEFKPHEWFKWSGSAIGIICLVAGAIAGLATFQATYLSQGTWGTSIGDYVALLTGSFVAFMGVTTSLHVAGMAQASFAKSNPAGASGGGSQPGAREAGDGGQQKSPRDETK